MTTYNGDPYLSEQLASFAAQTRLPDQLVVHDDRSTDRSVDLLHDFRRRAPFPVHIVENKQNIGFTANFGAALSHCDGDLIFLADQDDQWFPEKIAAIAAHFESNPALLLAIHDGELADENLNVVRIGNLSQVRSGYNNDEGFVTGALTALRRDLLRYALPIPAGVIGHDGWLHYVARMLGSRSVVEIPLQKIRRHSSNTSHWIASSLYNISRVNVLRQQSAEAPASSYADRLIYNQALFSRLDKSIPEDVIDRLMAERAAILRRDDLLSRNWFGRKIQAVSILFSGDYRYFNGLWSFLRDIVR